jgi:hypothetical protein
MTGFWALINTPWFGLLTGIFLGLLAGILSYVFYVRALRDPQPCFSTRSFQVVGSSGVMPQDVTINYKGKSVGRVTMSLLVFWNSGCGTLKGSEIVTSDPLRIELNGMLLDAEIIRQTRDVNALIIQPLDQSPSVLCMFDFLDAGDGATVRLMHTGTAQIRVAGTIRGIPQGVRNNGAFTSTGLIEEYAKYDNSLTFQVCFFYSPFIDLLACIIFLIYKTRMV